MNPVVPNDTFNQAHSALTYGNWTYSNGSSCDNYGLAVSEDGGYVLAGQQLNIPVTFFDAWLVKVDSTGIMQWNKTYGSMGADLAARIINCSDGGYAFTGYTSSYGSNINDQNMWLVKIDANGNLQWMKTYGGNGTEYGMNLFVTSDGGYLVVGCTDYYGVGNYDFYIVKTDSMGRMQWNKTFGYSGWDIAYGAVETADNGYVIAGSTNTSQSGYKGWLIKVDSNGNQIWNQTYSGPKAGSFIGIVKTSTGFTMAGTIGELNNYQIWLVNVDVNGKGIWSRTYGQDTTNCRVGDFITTSVEGYALTGYTYSPGTSVDLLLIKTDKLGNMEWNRTIGGGQYDEGLAVIQTAYGYALGGNSESYNNLTSTQYWLVLTDSNGRINYNLTTKAVGQGTVSPGNHTYMSGAIVNLVAVPDDGWTFSDWSGDASGASNTSIIMDNDKTVTAVFTQAVTPTPAPSDTPLPTSSSTPAPSPSSTSEALSPSQAAPPSPSAIPETITPRLTPAPTPIAPELSLIVLVPAFLLAIIAAVVKRTRGK